VERAVYFDAWFPRQHCYHPSLPARRLRMIDDLVDYRSTMLVWSALGGGSISLPYLEKEAFGELDERFRFYGFVNDSEFIEACRARGIRVFGIVFEVQGWEIPVELSPNEDQVLAMNELRGAGTRAWMGLREFSQDRFPKLWGPLNGYFPGGLVNSDGDVVTDLLEECCSRDIYGNPCHAHWVECPDREHYCYAMDRNNPVWREYLKAVVRIQIDAGVDGIQLDEAELPLTTLQYGGCFCKDCMKGFRSYLRDHPEAVPDGISKEELSDWHYGQWLLRQGYDFKDDQGSAPLFFDYLRFQRGQISQYFRELADYAREYAHTKGREVLVSGNFFNLQDHYLPLEPSVDVIVTEMRNTTYKQPAWYRYAAAFGGAKPVVVVENPYGGVVPELVRDLKAGRSYDLLRMSMYEAAALGASMSVPYGAWMGSVIEDSFWPPHELCAEVQQWLADHEQLYGHESMAKTAVVFSSESNFLLESRDRALANNTLNLTGDDKLPFWSVCEQLSDALQPFDVVFFSDGDLRSDTISSGDLRAYSTVILPHCHILTERQAGALFEYVGSGGRVVRIGPVGTNLDAGPRLAAHERVAESAVARPTVGELVGAPQVRASTEVDAALHLQRVDGGIALHLIRYDFDRSLDSVRPLGSLELEVDLGGEFDEVVSFGAPAPPAAALERSGSVHTLRLREVPLYSIALLRPGRNP
jgi:hypothetical protein